MNHWPFVTVSRSVSLSLANLAAHGGLPESGDGGGHHTTAARFGGDRVHARTGAGGQVTDSSGFCGGVAAAMTTASAVPGGWPRHSFDRPNHGYSRGYAGFGNDGEMRPVFEFDLGADYHISSIHLYRNYLPGQKLFTG